MLTENNIIQACEECVEVEVKRGSKLKPMGKFDIENLKVIVYRIKNTPQKEIDLTLLHEFIHARDLFRGISYPTGCHPRVEQEAIRTYQQNPEMVTFIKELYDLDF